MLSCWCCEFKKKEINILFFCILTKRSNAYQKLHDIFLASIFLGIEPEQVLKIEDNFSNFIIFGMAKNAI